MIAGSERQKRLKAALYKENRACAELQAKVEVLVALMLTVQKYRSINVPYVRLNHGISATSMDGLVQWCHGWQRAAKPCSSPFLLALFESNLVHI